MRKPTIKRILAFIIDMIIVSLLASALSSVKFLNPYYEKYNESQEKLVTIMEEAQNDNKQINSLYDSEELNDLSYEITKNSVFVNIYTLVISFLYFVCFQYITKGKTLGKKLFKIQVVSNDKKELRFIQLLKRSIIINSLVTTLIGIILVVTLSKANYLNYIRYVQIIETTLIIVSIGFVLYREDGRGLHDLFGDTYVIQSGDLEFFLKHEDVKEAQIVEEEKVESKKSKRTTRKKSE